jgi:pimeloyl-ACP methyl ester carboxylesterase
MALALGMTGAAADDRFISVNRFVPHTSTVRANAGQRVGIFLHEKLSTGLAARIQGGERPKSRVVLFVHGGSVPSVPDYDLQYKDYSWMEYLAAAGYDTFSMDQTGYGFSPRPMMDDPCNMDGQNRAMVTPNPLSSDCEPRYPYGLTTSQSDWDEVDRVVDFIRTFRGVERVSLVGWSGGGPRGGGYAARHPEKIDKLILFAPGYRSDGLSEPTDEVPRAGVPMRLQTMDTLMNGRWHSNVVCDKQVEPGIQEVIWQTIMSYDQLGSVWGPSHGVMRVSTGAGAWGWNATFAARVRVPTLILVGEQDGLLPAAESLYADLSGIDNKVLVKMACATHFAVWEATQYKFMHQASLEWLESATFRGRSQGSFRVGRQGAELSGQQ